MKPLIPKIIVAISASPEYVSIHIDSPDIVVMNDEIKNQQFCVNACNRINLPVNKL